MPHNAPAITSQRQISSYELLQKITSPAAQLAQQVSIDRLDTDLDDRWERVIDEISQADGITVKQQNGTMIRRWAKPEE